MPQAPCRRPQDIITWTIALLSEYFLDILLVKYIYLAAQIGVRAFVFALSFFIIRIVAQCTLAFFRYGGDSDEEVLLFLFIS